MIFGLLSSTMMTFLYKSMKYTLEVQKIIPLAINGKGRASKEVDKGFIISSLSNLINPQ